MKENDLQLKLLRIQQGIWFKKERVIIMFEGTDASGKGGAIRRIAEVVDPRGIEVHPIGPPTDLEKGKHWLYRFWAALPAPGIMTLFDRSWYGRVLVERVDKLTDEKNWRRAYEEINQFEAMLTNDGIHLIKFFLKISKDEQLKRFQKRLNDPYKQWKVTDADIKARKQWNEYQVAIQEMLNKSSDIPWNVIETDDKQEAREEILKILGRELGPFGKWMEKESSLKKSRKLR
jgi:polyphosphate kinase 2 (PPK2 family)